MDWITLGNILRSKLMGEVVLLYVRLVWFEAGEMVVGYVFCFFFDWQVLLASYVDLKHCEKKVDFIVDTDWK